MTAAPASGKIYTGGKHIKSTATVITGFLLTYPYSPAVIAATAKFGSIPVIAAKAYPAATPEKIRGKILPPRHPSEIQRFTSSIFASAVRIRIFAEYSSQLLISSPISCSPENVVSGRKYIPVAMQTPAKTQDTMR